MPHVSCVSCGGKEPHSHGHAPVDLGLMVEIGVRQPQALFCRSSLSVDKSLLTPLSCLETQEPQHRGISGTRTHPREFLRSRDQAWG